MSDPAPERSGVLLVNLGSPAAPTTAAVRRFLDEFLGDRLVVDLNPALWWLIRKGLVLPLRGPKSAALYRRIWTPEGSPLLVLSERLRARLEADLGRPVALGMRYGEPSIERALRELASREVEHVQLLSLYPQASRTTTGTNEREVRRVLAASGLPLALEVVPPYFDAPAYVAALADSVRAAVGERGVDHTVFSLHGLPVRYVDDGDPYRDQCEATARALADALGLADDAWTLAYQSRFGREPWLTPATDEVVRALGGTARRVAIVCPGFAVDCLETLEEIALELPAEFRAAGGEELVVVPCLNDSDGGVAALRGALEGQPAS